MHLPVWHLHSDTQEASLAQHAPDLPNSQSPLPTHNPLVHPVLPIGLRQHHLSSCIVKNLGATLDPSLSPGPTRQQRLVDPSLKSHLFASRPLDHLYLLPGRQSGLLTALVHAYPHCPHSGQNIPHLLLKPSNNCPLHLLFFPPNLSKYDRQNVYIWDIQRSILIYVKNCELVTKIKLFNAYITSHSYLLFGGEDIWDLHS